MTPPLLTIAIPTYNRAEPLTATLRVILPQIKNEPRVKLLILDNHSERPAVEVLSAFGVEPSSAVQVVRHPQNIGGCANILRCFERCDTEWVWVLSDDDKPREDAVRTILSDVDTDHLFVFYPFPQSPLPENCRTRTSGDSLNGLFEAIGHTITPLTLLSASIYRIGAFRDRLRKGYASATTGIPHLAMVFSELETHGGKWMLSDQTICEYTPPPLDQSWMVHSVFLGLPSGSAIFTTEDGLRHYRKCLLNLYRNVPEFVLINIIAGYGIRRWFSTQLPQLYRLMDAAYGPRLPRYPLAWIKWRMMGTFSYFPACFVWLVLTACRIIGRPPPHIGSTKRTD